jgi:antirestriction protein ArdC
MAISAMEYGNTSHSPQGETSAAIHRSAGISSQERLTTPKPPSNLCYYELEQIIELRNAWVLREESQATEDAINASPNLKPRGQEEVLKLADSALSILEKELQAGKSETLMKFLTAMSQFHNYSFNNLMLIALQRPDATHVAGFQAWKQLGRSVKKGEQGIRILAPIVLKQKPDQEGLSESKQDADLAEQPKRMLVGFKVVSVFDISQTSGEPLPDIGTVNGEPGENLARIESLIRSKGIELQYQELGAAEGLSKGGTIVIQPDLGSAKTFSVLAHELAHEMLHKGERRTETSKQQRELEAEAVAFVVCHAFGIESVSHASDYIPLYKGDAELLGKSLDYFRQTAAEIISKVRS